METHDTDLPRLLSEMRDASLDDALHALERSGLPHYPATAPAQNRQILSRLYDVVIRCLVDRTLDPIHRHARAVAHERFRDGFRLQEVHAAINVLEEVLWRVVTTRLPPDQIPQALGLVSTVLGAGKQSLAVEWVSLTEPASKLESLDQSALFRGTASGGAADL